MKPEEHKDKTKNQEKKQQAILRWLALASSHVQDPDEKREKKEKQQPSFKNCQQGLVAVDNADQDVNHNQLLFFGNSWRDPVTPKVQKPIPNQNWFNVKILSKYSPWVQQDPADSSKALCTFCNKSIDDPLNTLSTHSKSSKHIQIADFVNRMTEKKYENMTKEVRTAMHDMYTAAKRAAAVDAALNNVMTDAMSASRALAYAVENAKAVAARAEATIASLEPASSQERNAIQEMLKSVYQPGFQNPGSLLSYQRGQVVGPEGTFSAAANGTVLRPDVQRGFLQDPRQVFSPRPLLFQEARPPFVQRPYFPQEQRPPFLQQQGPPFLQQEPWPPFYQEPRQSYLQEPNLMQVARPALLQEQTAPVRLEPTTSYTNRRVNFPVPDATYLTSESMLFNQDATVSKPISETSNPTKKIRLSIPEETYPNPESRFMRPGGTFQSPKTTIFPTAISTKKMKFPVPEESYPNPDSQFTGPNGTFMVPKKPSLPPEETTSLPKASSENMKSSVPEAILPNPDSSFFFPKVSSEVPKTTCLSGQQSIPNPDRKILLAKRTFYPSEVMFKSLLAAGSKTEASEVPEEQFLPLQTIPDTLVTFSATNSKYFACEAEFLTTESEFQVPEVTTSSLEAMLPIEDIEDHIATMICDESLVPRLVSISDMTLSAPVTTLLPPRTLLTTAKFNCFASESSFLEPQPTVSIPKQRTSSLKSSLPEEQTSIPEDLDSKLVTSEIASLAPPASVLTPTSRNPKITFSTTKYFASEATFLTPETTSDNRSTLKRKFVYDSKELKAKKLKEEKPPTATESEQ